MGYEFTKTPVTCCPHSQRMDAAGRLRQVETLTPGELEKRREESAASFPALRLTLVDYRQANAALEANSDAANLFSPNAQRDAGRIIAAHVSG